MAVGQHQRIVRHRYQRLEAGIGSPQQGPEVVVLAEERVEPAAHGDLLVAVAHRPGPYATAQLTLRLHQDDRHAALAEPHRGGDAGDAAAGHHDGSGTSGRPPATRPGPMPYGLPVTSRAPVVAHVVRPAPSSGPLRARKVCRMPRCQPGTVRTSTSTNPAAYKRSVKACTESKAFTLRHR